MDIAQERIESLKAGIVGSSAAGLAFGVMLLTHPWIEGLQTGLVQRSIASEIWTIWSSGAIALMSGFLFGVTYRYIVRADQNPHLNSGAVLAFGLVRGLAEVDGIGIDFDTVPGIAIAIIESILVFAIAQWLLRWAMQKKWVKPFES